MSEHSSRFGRFRRLIGSALTILIGAYAILILIYFVLRLIAGEQLDLVALGNSLMPTILVPSVVFLILMLILRRWQIAVMLIPAVVLLTAQYGWRFVPTGNRLPSDADPDISILTYNVASQRADFDRIIRVIREADADVVALQELLTGASNAISTELGEVYPYRAMHPTDDFARGIGILSKFPITEDRYFDNFILGSQRVRLTMPDGASIVFYSAHPVSPRAIGDFDGSVRDAEIYFLLEDTKQFGVEPIILAGDFNTTDQTESYARVFEHFEDAYRVAGFGFGPTFPNLGRFGGGLTQLVPPVIRIDYVFYSRGCWEARNARVIGESGGSDHYPLYAELVCET